MPADIHERPMSAEERSCLQRILEGPDRTTEPVRPMGRFRLAFNVGIASWFVLMMLSFLCWQLIAWVVRITTGAEIGPDSAAGERILPLTWLVSAVIAVPIAVFWVTRRKKKKKKERMRPDLLADLEAGRVLEEHYEFTAALRMQEQEHGGLFYFFRTTDGRVFVLYDYESQDLGVQGNDPLTSSFKPGTRLTMVRAPETGWVIHKSFSGEPLDPGEPLDLFADDLPRDEALCDIPWDQLEAKLCR